LKRGSNIFDDFFLAATGSPDIAPLPYQRRLAENDIWPARIEIPTGLGKTLAVLTAWLWRRRAECPARTSTPRRLVYCLPMRVLVEQTRDVAREVLARLDLPTRVVVLMGGVEHEREWDTQPEDDAIIIGTQDMLLSRALNRGYGMTRFRWPLHFGLLNNDCLWVIDEVQLVGSGIATTAQLQALRRKLGTALPTRTCWMSATMDDRWLRTVDVDDEDLAGRLLLDAQDEDDPVVTKRISARKTATPASVTMGDLKALAREVLAAHRPGTRTLAIVNTVDRARELFIQLRKAKGEANIVLLHSRFRPADRDRALARALAKPETHGTIFVSTQVVEAGVDVSSATLFTEMAPWASLVQRFGRCNRRGEDEDAHVYWIPLPPDESSRAKIAQPYELEEMLAAEATLIELSDVGPRSLPKRPMSLDQGLVLRRRDLLDLFDTTPDLMGDDVDVSRFIRDADDNDVRVFWRDVDEAPIDSEPSPSREEICVAPIAVVRDWAKALRPMWTWDCLRGIWQRVERIYPGLTLFLRTSDGGYDPQLGLVAKGTDRVPLVQPTESSKVDDERDREDRRNDGDPLSEWQRWYTLARHSDDVAKEAEWLAKTLAIAPPLADALITAGRWHDAGKSHSVWQAAAKKLGTDPPSELVAKSQALRGRIIYEGRPGFRHELASALLALRHRQSDLVCFLIACHHGKVRLSLRALPTEAAPFAADGREDPEILHARGIWEGDSLPEVHLGSGLVIPPTKLTLKYMQLGDDDETGPSWSARVLTLRDDPNLGPFRLGFLEALIQCADERASRQAQETKP
jgi:CRISPR-associated endonuclease/helicase Cas3